MQKKKCQILKENFLLKKKKLDRDGYLNNKVKVNQIKREIYWI